MHCCMSTRRCICVALQVKTVASNPFLDLTAWRQLLDLKQLTLEVFGGGVGSSKTPNTCLIATC